MKVSVDIETTGLNPATSQILEAAFIWREKDSYRGIRVVCCHQRIEGECIAISMNAALLLEITQQVRNLDFVNKRFFTGPWMTVYDAQIKSYYIQDWDDLYECFSDAKCPFLDTERNTMIGKNPSFDHQFLSPYFQSKLFDHRHIDIGNLWLLPDDELPPGMSKTLERADIAPGAAHTAVWDALVSYQAYEKWRSVHEQWSKRST